jgi:23S rRNA (adenine2503-C2)-methyltransferase
VCAVREAYRPQPEEDAPVSCEMEVQHSEIDDSVNFVEQLGPRSAFESRYVRRSADYVSCYLSTQTGCEQRCRFCHLTTTGQSHFIRDATVEEICEQAHLVLTHYDTQRQARVVHFNFMARGEPLSSRIFVARNLEIFARLADLAREHNLLPRYSVSTIIPKTFTWSFAEVFPNIQPDIYYSLYSLDPGFRSKWMPMAMDPQEAITKLVAWQRHSKKIIKLHYALIYTENDLSGNPFDIVSAIRMAGLRCDVTLVRYNPPNDKSRESDRYEWYADVLRRGLPESKVKVLDRVGFDVKASCGMFVPPTVAHIHGEAQS